MTNFFRLSPLVIISILTLVPAHADPVEAWEKLGPDPLLPTASQYINTERISQVGDGWTLAPVFTVYEQEVAGIDIADGTGGTYFDTDFPHKSRMTWEIVHCEKKVVATLESHYFSGTEMDSEDLIYLEKRKNFPSAMPAINGDLVVDYLCP